MILDISTKSLPVYEALASHVRLSIIKHLTIQPMNIRELANANGLSSAIMTMHIKKLEKSGIIRTEMIPGKAGIQKLCILNVDRLEVNFPTYEATLTEYHQTELSVGHYTDFLVEPTCGLATIENIVGEFDEPRYLLAPERVNAKIIWFSKGYLEYKVPNFLLSSQTPQELDISLEISSEAPFTNENWPSDITFYLNHVKLGSWTSPGDFGDRLGKYTPEWWPKVVNQYGLLKFIRVTTNGTFIDGNRISDITINEINIRDKLWTFRIAVQDDADHIGGVTIFGTGFGNYNQDIVFRLFYTKDAKISDSH
ncbi:MAG: ArsR/SmtB family transcription factor [Anaerobacillus sp.]|uniref:ArsR/SmtB family transcription factor n=1 Tax=Anaerobacillus sp. TaxID=1872506 RepID=UPI00391B71BF